MCSTEIIITERGEEGGLSDIEGRGGQEYQFNLGKDCEAE